MPRLAKPTTLVLALLTLAPSAGDAQAQRDSTIVVEPQQEAASAFSSVREAFVQADIEVAVASADQGLILSEPERMGRQQQIAYAQFRADLEGLGPICEDVGPIEYAVSKPAMGSGK